MRFILVLCLSFCLSLQGQQKINFVEIGLDQAIQRAKIENKMVFIDAYAKWCRPCKQMDIEFKNPAVIAYFNKNFINVKVNVDGIHGSDYKLTYQIVFLPTLIFADSHGNVRTKIDNIVSGNELVSIGKFINNKYGPSGNRNLVSRDVSTTTKTPEVVSKIKTSTSNVKKQIFTSDKENLSSSKEKVLYVMGEDSSGLPPEVLKQEAYFRMELMDGSHVISANNYLKTQTNWLTEENMLFIFDFLNDCKSDLFNHVIDNRKIYESLIGESRILNTLNILITKELDRAFPRPTKEEAFKLYSIINPESAEEKSDSYNLENLFNNADFEKFSSLGLEHIHKYPNTNTSLTYRICDLSLNQNHNKKTLKTIRDNLIDLVSTNQQNELYFFSLAKVQLKLKNKKKALESITKAISICQAKDLKNPEIHAFAKYLEES